MPSALLAARSRETEAGWDSDRHIKKVGRGGCKRDRERQQSKKMQVVQLQQEKNTCKQSTMTINVFALWQLSPSDWKVTSLSRCHMMLSYVCVSGNLFGINYIMLYVTYADEGDTRRAWTDFVNQIHLSTWNLVEIQKVTMSHDKHSFRNRYQPICYIWMSPLLFTHIFLHDNGIEMCH